MKKLLAFLCISSMIIACGGGGDDTTNTSSDSSDSTSEPVAAADGEKIYKQYCVTCHGLYGDMGASGAANLTESTLSVEERIPVITNGRNTMTGFKALLNEEKIKAVAEYTMTLSEEQ
jgi:mono/diheme cytochrome c family protein